MKTVKSLCGVIVKSNDEVLLCKRAPNQSLPNIWSIPSGHLMDNESPREGAKREFEEETGLKCGELSLVGFINGYGKIKNNSFMHVYKMNLDEKILPNLQKAKDGHEHTMCKYFKYDNLPLTNENDQLREIIKKVLS